MAAASARTYRPAANNTHLIPVVHPATSLPDVFMQNAACLLLICNNRAPVNSVRGLLQGHLWDGVIDKGVHESAGIRSPGQGVVHREQDHPMRVQCFAVGFGKGLDNTTKLHTDLAFLT